jgi:CPA1 family monovalent cation:H+ antiporter
VKFWQIVVLVAAGIAYGAFQPGKLTYAFGQATLYVFLPALLFEAAWNLSYRAIVRQWASIATLAGPGVLITALAVAAALTIAGIPLIPALLAGAILSATDPIAVIAVFRRLKVPKTLATIVECESLFNDAVAVVLYRGVLAALALGAAADAKALSTVTVLALGGAAAGAALGIAVAFAAARLLRSSGGASVQAFATICCAYGAYFAAEELHLSGIFAVVACGIALRYFERRWIDFGLAEEVRRFWDSIALGANALVFFLVGAALQIGQLAQEPGFVVACLVAIAVSRIVVAGLLLPCGYPREWIAVVRVAGMRGALSIALAIALPASVPYREAIVDASFAVALATIIASALTTDRVVARTVRP